MTRESGKTAIERDLTLEELSALRGAGAWYAKYHAARIAELANDPSAYAEMRRGRYLALVAGLRKLGFDMALPDALNAIDRGRAAPFGTSQDSQRGQGGPR